jgi:hypothetical protein
MPAFLLNLGRMYQACAKQESSFFFSHTGVEGDLHKNKPTA